MARKAAKSERSSSGPVIVNGEAAPPVAQAGPVTARELTHRLELQRREFERLRQLIEHVNRGLGLAEILDFVFEECRDTIPYNRIAYAKIDYDAQRVIAQWARSDGPPKLPEGYWHPFSRTSLMDVARSGRPRIINDLVAYAEQHPQSDVTHMLVEEGLRSSLTCPLVIEGRPVGFLFFDHQDPAVYSRAHVEFFEQVAGVISVAVERGRMFTELADQKDTISRQNRELAEENSRSQAELDMARKVQLSMIPESLPSCELLESALLYEPATQVGGDLIDAASLGEGKMLLVVADAMGHGVPAALLMTTVQAAFRGALGAAATLGSAPSPAALLRETNRAIIDLFKSNYVTAVCAVVDCQDRTITFSLAGHPPPLIRRARDGSVDSVTEGDIPMGIDNDTAYCDVTVPFGPGDVLLVYTDGVIEAADRDRQRFGLQSLTELVGRSGAESARALIATLRSTLGRHCSCRSLDDDMAVVAIRHRP